MKLSGAHVLVTGASRGIGSVLAEGAARRGASVSLVARCREPLEERARQHVVPPLRMTPVLALSWLPRRVGDLVQTGLPRR